MTRRTIISADEHTLLLEVVEGWQPMLRPLVDELVAEERRLTADEGNLLRDAVAEELAYCGFDERYVPTDRGRALEDLIDRLGHATALFD